MSENKNFFRASAEDFKKIPGSPVAYWMGRGYFRLFEKGVSLAKIAPTRKGMFTGDNDRYLKLWPEISWCKFGVEFRAYSKGGSFRRWYGNYENVIHWGRSGEIIRQSKGAGNIVEELYFKPCITWSLIASGRPSFRAILSNEFVMGDAGPICSAMPTDMNFLLGYLNTCIVFEIGKLMAPTINCSNGVVGDFPVLDIGRVAIERNVAECIKYSRGDWDRYEGSWDFTMNPLVAARNVGGASDESEFQLLTLYAAVREKWAKNCEEMRRLETENNRIFIDAYGLQDELTPEVPWEEITLTCNPWYRYGEKNASDGDEFPVDETLEKKLRTDTIKELLSYAVGCLMGRYSLDKEGLILASQGETLEDYWQRVGVDDGGHAGRVTLPPDEDGILPVIAGANSFADDAKNRVTEFIRVVFGAENLNANLNFIEECLGTTLESYLAKEFWKDHKKMYQNRPIYWLFSSKKGAFQCLVYMHRMDAYTATKVRNDYLLKHIEFLRTRIAADTARSSDLSAQERRDLKKMQQALDECLEYDGRLHVVADRMQPIDLDDGVVVNYAKFGDVLAKLK